MRWALVTLLALAACGRSGDQDASQPPPAPAAAPAAATQPAGPLDQLSPEAYDNARSLGAGCDFSQGGPPLLVALEEGAIVSRGGRPVTLRAESRFDPTGGFFVGGPLRISIGRTAEAGTEAGENGRWPAQLRLNDDSRDLSVTIQGYWSCGRV